MIRLGLMGTVHCLVAAHTLSATDCPPNPLHDDRTDYLETNDYSLTIDSGSGAKGDVVAVTVTVESRLAIPTPWAGFNLAICHNPAVAELVGAPAFTEEAEFLASAWGLVSDSTSNGISIGIGFKTGSYNERFPSELPLTLLILYYRLIGNPGDHGPLEFCDGVLDFGPGSCFMNTLVYHTDEPYFYVLGTTRKLHGSLTVLEGPTTRPERPPEPAEAAIYDDLPSAEQANFRVRVTDGVGWPGARDVTVDIYATADVEYVGLEIPLDFDEQYLRVTRVENRLKRLASVLNNDNVSEGAANDEGYVVLFSGLGNNNRRIALSGEETHVATLYCDVLESASAIDVTTITVATVGDRAPVDYPPWIGVRHRNMVTPDETAVRSEVEPFAIVNGLLAIGPGPTPFLRGDSDGDGVVRLNDAQLSLNYLFLAGIVPPCMDAADANDDGTLDIADPVRIIGLLFLGSGQLPRPSSEPGGDPTADALECQGSAA